MCYCIIANVHIILSLNNFYRIFLPTQSTLINIYHRHICGMRHAACDLCNADECYWCTHITYHFFFSSSRSFVVFFCVMRERVSVCERARAHEAPPENYKVIFIFWGNSSEKWVWYIFLFFDCPPVTNGGDD